MKTSIRISLGLLIFGALFFFSCNNGTNPINGGNHVYVYGNTNYPAGSDQWFAYYWQDGTRFKLPVDSAGGSSVHGVAESANGTRYIAGEYWLKDADDEACYWVNEGNRQDICPGCALAIATNNNTVYVLGHDYDHSGYDNNNSGGNYNYWYWKTGWPTPQDLQRPDNNNPDMFIYPQAIELNGSDVYIAGYYYDSTTADKVKTACYWTGDGKCTDLGGPACAYDLVFQNNDMYAVGGYVEDVGYYLGDDTAWMPCIWENPNANKKWIAFTNDVEECLGRIDSVTTENNLLYMAGYYVDTTTDGHPKKACYWHFNVDDPQWTNIPTQGNPHTEWNTWANRNIDLLPAPTDTDSFVHALAVSDGMIYAAGEYYDNVPGYDGEDMYNVDAGTICYWANGERHDLYDATEVCGIAVSAN